MLYYVSMLAGSFLHLAARRLKGSRSLSSICLALGLIRIDYVIVSPSIEPLAIGETCPPIGDHCLVQAELGLVTGAASAGSAITR